MAEFRKKIGNIEITEGAIYWNETQDQLIQAILPDTMVFELTFEGEEFRNLTIDWVKRKLLIGKPLMSAIPGSEIILSSSEDNSMLVNCEISIPTQNLIIRKRLSHNEYSRRHLKWYAREDELYRRLFPSETPVNIQIGTKLLKSVTPDFSKRKIRLGEALRCFSPGEDILLRWDTQGVLPFLVIEREELISKASDSESTPVRALVAKLLSRPLGDFKEGDIKALLVLLDENKQLWERIGELQDENKGLKEQVSIVESVFEQLSENHFFDSKKCFVTWFSKHIGRFEKGLRIIHQDFMLQLPNGKKGCIDFLCQDKKGVLTLVEAIFNPEVDKLNLVNEFFKKIENNLVSLSEALTDGSLKATSIRCIIVSNKETPELVEMCLQSGIKLFMVKSGYAIDVID